MTVARINSAHDAPDVWQKMVANVRDQAAHRGISCRILFDLAGPKIRTGQIEPGPEIIRVAPILDAHGRLVRAGELKLVPEGALPPAPGELPVPGAWLSTLVEGDAVELEDARGKARTLIIRSRETSGICIAACQRTAYILSGTRLRASGGRIAAVGRLPCTEQTILLRVGDQIDVLKAPQIGRPAPTDAGGAPIGPATISCTLPEALAGVQPGHSIWFDDGKIGGVVVSADDRAVRVRITAASMSGDNLRSDKGINLPDTPTAFAGFTEQDRATLPFAAANADMVGMSFVHSPAEVRDLAGALSAIGGR
jgi:pyruvate kinase